MKNRSGQQKFQMFGLLLIALACSAALLGGLGAIHYMNGSMLQSGATLVMPAYLGYWAWQARCSDLHLKRGPASIQADSRPGITATDSPFKPALAANEPAFSRADRHFIRAN